MTSMRLYTKEEFDQELLNRGCEKDSNGSFKFKERYFYPPEIDDGERVNELVLDRLIKLNGLNK